MTAAAVDASETGGRARPGRVMIVGAGIGGVTAAVALRRRGLDVTVFERAGDLRTIQVGLGVLLWPNATRALQEAGLAERAEAAGALVDVMEWRSAQGKPWATWPVGEEGRKLGAPAIGITRANLHATMSEALEDGVIALGAEYVGFEQDEAGVTARFADGREERGSVLVGADGIDSIVRRQLLGETRIKRPGVQILQATVDFEHMLLAPHSAHEWWGPGTMLICYPVRERLYWICFTRAPLDAAAGEGGPKAAMDSLCRGWVAPVEALVEATPAGAVARAEAVWRAPVRRWGEGRVTLLGDAAHPMTPHLAQGAGQAIEDAVVLARQLGGEDDVASALRGYERRRIPRTAQLVRENSAMAAVARIQHPAAVSVRNRLLGLVLPTVAWKRWRKHLAHDF